MFKKLLFISSKHQKFGINCRNNSFNIIFNTYIK